jgi:hypothetical protein
MSRWALRTALALVVLGLAAVSAVTAPGRAEATGPVTATPTGAAREIAGTIETKVVVNRFSAVGKKVVGHGVATSTVRRADGVTSVTKKGFRLTVRTANVKQRRTQQVAPTCHILLLELDELDLTLLGLRVFLRSAEPDRPIELRLHADRAGGILGRLFCDLTEGSATAATAKKAARQLNTRVKNSTILRANGTIYAPARAGQGSANSSQSPSQAVECDVLHLILGPLHLDLLGLIVDLNKIELDIKAIPGTVLGDLFCQLAPPPPPDE